MARTRKALPTQVDIAHLISAGMLASVCPRALIEQVLSDTGKASQRERLLPAPAVVYYVMALALWREAPLEEVLRVVCEGLQWLGGGQAQAVQASKSAISQARTRLGPEVMRTGAASAGATGSTRGLVSWLARNGAGRQLHGRGRRTRQCKVFRLPECFTRSNRVPSSARIGVGGMRHPCGRGCADRSIWSQRAGHGCHTTASQTQSRYVGAG